MLSLNALTGTLCQNKLNRQWLEPASWFIRKPRCTRLAGMNGLVVRTKSFTGCAKLNSKDENNRSRSCGQGCELWPFPEGLRGARAHGSSGGTLAQCLKWLCAHCRGPLTVTLGLQENQNKRKMSELSSSLHTTQQSPPLTPPPPSNISEEKWVQCRVQLATAYNLTRVWRSTPAFFGATDREELLASWSGSVSMNPWEIIG